MPIMTDTTRYESRTERTGHVDVFRTVRRPIADVAREGGTLCRRGCGKPRSQNNYHLYLGTWYTGSQYRRPTRNCRNLKIKGHSDSFSEKIKNLLLFVKSPIDKCFTFCKILPVQSIGKIETTKDPLLHSRLTEHRLNAERVFCVNYEKDMKRIIVTAYFEGGKEVTQKRQRIITEIRTQPRRPNETESVCPTCGQRINEKKESYPPAPPCV